MGTKAPNFEVNNQDEELVKLPDFKGQKVVLYFYPKGQISGCIAEPCNLRDNCNTLLKEGYLVFLKIVKSRI